MLARLSDTDRRAFREGARDYSPTLMAIFSWGLVTGIAMSKSVLTLPQALTMSLLCYAGSSQLAVLPLLAAKLPIWTALLTAAMVNTPTNTLSVSKREPAWLIIAPMPAEEP